MYVFTLSSLDFTPKKREIRRKRNSEREREIIDYVMKSMLRWNTATYFRLPAEINPRFWVSALC